MLFRQLGHLVVDALNRAGRDFAIGFLDERGRGVDHARGDARGFDRRQQRVLTLEISVQRLHGRPGGGWDIGEVGQGPGRTHVVIVEVDDFQGSRALRSRFRRRCERTRCRNAGAQCTKKFTPRGIVCVRHRILPRIAQPLPPRLSGKFTLN
jgi:hypothetical protein